jgi:hypothetical protein
VSLLTFQIAENHDVQNSFAACFCRCDTWCLASREEHKLKFSENNVLRKMKYFYMIRMKRVMYDIA